MQQHAEKMTERIIKGVEDSPECGPMLMRMSERDRKGMYAFMETAGRLMCMESGEVITDQVTERVTKNLIDLVKELCVTKEHLEEREEHYTDVLKASNEKQAEKLEKIIVDVVSRHDEEQEKKFQKIRSEQDKERERGDKHEHEIALLRQSNASQAIQSDQQMTMMKMIHASQESLSDLIEARFEAVTPTKTSTPKKINISNIPAVGWVVMGIVSIAVLSLSTGHAAEFYAWLSGVKFGGVK